MGHVDCKTLNIINIGLFYNHLQYQTDYCWCDVASLEQSDLVESICVTHKHILFIDNISIKNSNKNWPISFAHPPQPTLSL